mgnify:CR=1 FL=1
MIRLFVITLIITSIVSLCIYAGRAECTGEGENKKLLIPEPRGKYQALHLLSQFSTDYKEWRQLEFSLDGSGTWRRPDGSGGQMKWSIEGKFLIIEFVGLDEIFRYIYDRRNRRYAEVKRQWAMDDVSAITIIRKRE